MRRAAVECEVSYINISPHREGERRGVEGGRGRGRGERLRRGRGEGGRKMIEEEEGG